MTVRVATPGASAVVDMGLGLLALGLAVALQAVDAAMDALFLEQKPYGAHARRHALRHASVWCRVVWFGGFDVVGGGGGGGA